MSLTSATAARYRTHSALLTSAASVPGPEELLARLDDPLEAPQSLGHLAPFERRFCLPVHVRQRDERPERVCRIGRDRCQGDALARLAQEHRQVVASQV